jgi:hypothetical protein
MLHWTMAKVSVSFILEKSGFVIHLRKVQLDGQLEIAIRSLRDSKVVLQVVEF